MKILTTILIVLLAHGLTAQTENYVIEKCDSVILLDGSVKMMQVREVKRNKIVYFLCCENCGVPRKLALNEIDTIVFNQNGFHIQELSRISAEKEVEVVKLENESIIDTIIAIDELIFKNLTNDKLVTLKPGDYLNIKDLNGKYKGHIKSITKDVIIIEKQKTSTNDLEIIKINEIKWLRIYSDSKTNRGLGKAMKIIGTIGTPFLTFVSLIFYEAAYPEEGTGFIIGAIGALGIMIGGQQIEGTSRHHINSESWQIVK